ncbi:30S ribosomal protein S18 [Candidatus Woesebacteria bacterium RIFCSPHIGHO2_01_FULL_38_26b]|uniref:Small ribosomal subunit protein bS18 n=1 Tax=Candidatus Woesebacteria bacterium RIFCSPHIGHO2_01_FULL_38_26b TaxID=1802491 RepID=A0A1F7XZU7_9BACT|nr:MAG: 30S ribosomal protein S18 [Candidatus Woesebacteria bacterium RIFCSPHIGHO2_01_FULL_38_26b]
MRNVRKRIVPTSCPFCQENKTPDYKDYKYLRKFLSERAKIIGKEYSGVCSKHQRKLSRAVKRARYLSLLPYIPSV